MATLATSFLIGSSSILLVTGPTIKERMSSFLDQIRLSRFGAGNFPLRDGKKSLFCTL